MDLREVAYMIQFICRFLVVVLIDISDILRTRGKILRCLLTFRTNKRTVALKIGGVSCQNVLQLIMYGPGSKIALRALWYEQLRSSFGFIDTVGRFLYRQLLLLLPHCLSLFIFG